MGGQAFVKEQFMPPEIPNKTNIKSPKFEPPSLSCGILEQALIFIQGQKNADKINCNSQSNRNRSSNQANFMRRLFQGIFN